MTRERLVRPGSKTAAKAAFVAFVAASLLSFTPVPAAAQDPKPEVYFVPDVVGQFNALSLRPEPFGMWVWGHPEPSDNLDKHYQGIARSHGPGIPHMYLSWNGNDSLCIGCDDEPGQLFVIRMLSRDATGERLRSNRLYPGHPIRGFQNGIDVGTPPDLSDCLVARIVFDGTGEWPHYRHPGAMQSRRRVGRTALEAGRGRRADAHSVHRHLGTRGAKPAQLVCRHRRQLELWRRGGRVDAGPKSLRPRPAIPHGDRRRRRPGAPSVSIALHRRERPERCERPQGREPPLGGDQ